MSAPSFTVVVLPGTIQPAVQAVPPSTPYLLPSGTYAANTDYVSQLVVPPAGTDVVQLTVGPTGLLPGHPLNAFSFGLDQSYDYGLNYQTVAAGTWPGGSPVPAVLALAVDCRPACRPPTGSGCCRPAGR